MDRRKKSSCNKVRRHRDNQKQRNDPRTTRSETETAFAMSLQLREKEMVVSGTGGGRERQQWFKFSRSENKVAQGEGSKREFPHDLEKCHRSTEIGEIHNKGIEADGKSSKGDKEALSCQAQGTEENREGKQRRKKKRRKKKITIIL